MSKKTATIDVVEKHVDVMGDHYRDKVEDLGERLNYLVKTMQEHADAINEMRQKLTQVSGRMGL